ncbi:MAG: hypothetical protein Q9220_007482 [cf. Caloplaca sp. 1 TL-2023]
MVDMEALDYPPQLTAEQREYLLTKINDWSILNGLAVRRPSFLLNLTSGLFGSTALTAPVTLFPSLFPRVSFDEAQALQRAYNVLYAAIARDRSWLKHIVEELIEVDDFLAKLWNVHLEVEKGGYVQDLSLGLFRSDYMVHKKPADPDGPPTIKQVEFNTIASSFGGLSTQVSGLHFYLSRVAAYPSHPYINDLTRLPHNDTISSLTKGLSAAHRAYGPSKSSPLLPLCILFIVQSPESNIFDQLHLSTTLETTHKIPTFRLPFSETLSRTSINPSDAHRALIYTPPHSPSTPYEVTLLYFRAGYSPTDYLSPEHWTARLHLERSAAIKCPSILTHLSGSKKIQQELATPGSPHLSNFLGGKVPDELIERVRSTFAAIYPLDDSAAGQRAIAIATDSKKAENYVLKPQREGGGNNVYGVKIPAFLKSLGEEQKKWKAYILMELIKPPVLRNSILRNGEVREGDVVGELGVYGVCLWRCGRSDAGGKRGEEGEEEGQVLENREAGFLLRTKGRESEEGGVAAGFGAVDSPCLV